MRREPAGRLQRLGRGPARPAPTCPEARSSAWGACGRGAAGDHTAFLVHFFDLHGVGFILFFIVVKCMYTTDQFGHFQVYN